MIRFGPAGIPLSCKGRTLRDGIIDLHHLGLTAMEVQFIKVNSSERAPLLEEEGKRPREIPEQLMVEVGQPGQRGIHSSPELLERPLSKKSRLTTLSWFLAKDYNVLSQARALARSVDIQLSLHAPFYVDFMSSPEARERSLDHYRWACVLASALGAKVLVCHLGFYGSEGPTESLERVSQELKSIRQWLDGLPGGQRTFLGIEPNGHPEVIGSEEETLYLTRKVNRAIPILNIPHLAVREGTNFENKKDMETLMERFFALSHGELHVNFSGVSVQGRGSFRMTPIKRGKIKFESVAEAISEKGYDATIVSSSPLLEHDAMYMKLLYERALAKRFAKRVAPVPEKMAAKTPPKPLLRPESGREVTRKKKRGLKSRQLGRQGPHRVPWPRGDGGPHGKRLKGKKQHGRETKGRRGSQGAHRPTAGRHPRMRVRRK